MRAPAWLLVLLPLFACEKPPSPSVVPTAPPSSSAPAPALSASAAPTPTPAPVASEPPPAANAPSACTHGKAMECEKACQEKPNGPDCVTLAGMLLDGVGVAKDPERSLDILRKACDAKLADGCRVLGLMYTEGLGTPYNEGSFMLGARYYTKACDLGSMQACDHLGELYAVGKGLKKDARKSKELFQKACAGGWEPACQQGKR